MSLQDERRCSRYETADTYQAVPTDRDKLCDKYIQLLWLYAESICRCHPDRLQYLMSVELPFLLYPEVIADLKLMVNILLAEQRRDLKVAS